jgi:large subunit ribosomal protein L24
MKLKIKKGDNVQIISGSDKGKKGQVIAVDPIKLKIRVQGVKIMTHFSKKDGITTSEGFIDYSKVKLVSSEPKKATKTTAKRA